MSQESISKQDNKNMDYFGEGGKDFLQRKKPGDNLSKLMRKYINPQVVALNGNWGTGKTWFLEKWAHQHQSKFADTYVVYFDAFAHDYISDPLPALVSALEEHTSLRDRNIKRMKIAAFKVAQIGARVGLAVATSGASELGMAGSGIIKSLGNQAEKDLEEYWRKEKGRGNAMKQFRSALKALTSMDNGKRLIFVVDELDRCRPDYALEVLEVIKHFFSVLRVHFVLGVNLVALEDMVRARYGAKDYANEYLEKFIHIKLTLPEEVSDGYVSKKNVLEYLDHLCREAKVPDHIGGWLKVRAKFVSSTNSISLRQIEHIVSAVDLANSESKRTDSQRGGLPVGRYGIMVDLILSKIVRPDLHQKFLDATITPKELSSYLGPRFESVSSEEARQWLWVYDTWLLLSQNESQIDCPITTPPLSSEEVELYIGGRIEEIQNSLTPFHFSPGKQELRDLPKKIQSDWLDLFQFTEQETTI